MPRTIRATVVIALLAMCAHGAHAADTREFRIAPQPLSQALVEFSQQSQRVVTASSDLLAGKQASPVSGEMAPEEALARLLEGSGLEFVIGSGGDLVVISASARRDGEKPAARVERQEDMRLAQAQGEASANPSAAGAQPAAESAAQAGGQRLEAASELEEIVVEAKYNTPDASVGVLGRRSLLDTPSSVNVITHDLLENLQITSVDQLVRTDGSLTVSFAGVGYYPAMMIRGFDLDNWSNYRFDGLTITNNGATGLESVDRIEVLKGLSGFQAGFATPGGIINYVTKRPTATLQSSLELNFDDQGDLRGHLDVGGPLGERFGARVNLAAERLRSYVDDADGQRRFASLAFDWRPLERTVVHFDVDHHRRAQSQQPMLTVTTLGDLPRKVDPKRNIGQKWDEYRFDYTLLRADVEHELSSKWSAALKANWMDFNRDQSNAFSYEPIEPDGSFNVYEYQSLGERFRPFNALARVRGEFETGPLRHELTFGASYTQIKAWWPNESVFEFVGVNNIYDPRQLPASGLRSGPATLNQRTRETGLFVYDAMGFGERWQLHLGARHAAVAYDSFDPQGAASRYYDKSVTTPTGALVFRPNRWTSIYASYSEGLEQGGQAPVTAVNGLEILDPLASEQYELGAKLATDRVDLSAAVFEIRKGLEYLRADGYYVQDGRQTHRGLELASAGRLASRLNVFMSAMLLDAKLDDTGDAALNGTRAAGVPRFNASAFLDYELAWPAGLAVTFGAYHTGERSVIPGQSLRIPAFTHFNAGMRYGTRLFSQPTDLRLTIDNLTDEFYYSSVAACCAQFDAGPARVIRASIKTYFQ